MTENKTNKPTRKRYQILALIFFTVCINYMDRSNISVAAFAISDELDLTTVQMGIIFSAFAWTYSALQIPGGILVDYLPARLLYPVIIALWSIATLVQGLVNSMAALIGCRAAIGVFEAPSYPANNKIVTNWFPEGERAGAIAMYTSGQYIGLAFLTPALILIQNYFGWRGLFIISGGVGILWAIAWYYFYREPHTHPTVNKEELDHIAKGGGMLDNSSSTDKKKPFTWHDLKYVLSQRKLWGVYIGQFCKGSLFIFFLTWFPTYLVNYRGLDFIETGFLASIPFLGAFVGVLLSGLSSDALVKRGFSNELARKAPILVGMLLSLFIIGANYTESTFWVIFFLTFAFFGNGLAAITWVFISLLAPKRLMGLTGGVFNFIGGLAGVITPIVIGFLVTESDFQPALLYIGTLALLGFCSYLFLIGKVERIEERV